MASMVYKKDKSKKDKSKDKDKEDVKAKDKAAHPDHKMSAEKEKQLVATLRANVADVEALPDEPDFFKNTETLQRYLRAREWKLADAEKLLRETVEWRRKEQPLRRDCKWCRDRPGYHIMRQVGHDLTGRPVIYSCFAQAATQKLTTEDSINHTVYLIENAKKTMKPGVSSWVFIIDATGVSFDSCNPKLAHGVTQVMSNHYPERLGLCIILNHSSLFHTAFKAIKVFLHPNTVDKIFLVSKKKIREMFDQHFNAELSDWLVDEIKLNKGKMPISQKEFWRIPPNPADKTSHDPRGCRSYVDHYVTPYKKTMGTKDHPLHVHNPHPNVIDALMGRLKRSPSVGSDASSSSFWRSARASSKSRDEESGDEEEQSATEMEIPAEYQLPADVKKF